jgi:hypothetical protein
MTTANMTDFVAWLQREMPAGTVISDPAWWAPRILRAAQVAASPVTEARGEPEASAQPDGRCSDCPPVGYPTDITRCAACVRRGELVAIPASEMPEQVLDSLMDSQYLAGVSAGWNAAQENDSNAALKAIHDAYTGHLKPLRDWQKAGKPVAAPALSGAVAAEPYGPDVTPGEAREILGRAAYDEAEDMAEVGRALMKAIEANAPDGWHPADCPSEIVGDLRNMLDEANAALAAAQPQGDDARDADGGVMNLWYCESTKLCLHPGQLYRFKVDPECKTCQEMKAEYDAAMSPATGAKGDSNA